MPELPFPVAFGDLPIEKFPFEIDFVSTATGEVVHRIEVPGAGAVRIPPLAQDHGPIRVRINFADGEVIVLEPGEGGR